ncbi:MAG: FAD:protein FMN transferase [Planctomycetota bacterium]|nr:MAG: FAD:protein FMN transferase [Planctomycetota bacterium]
MAPQNTRRDFLAGRALLRLVDTSATPSEIAPPQAGPTIRLETRAMACPWAVVLNPGPPALIMHASDVLDRVHPLEDLLSIYREQTPVAQLRHLPAGEWRKLPDEVFQLLLRCRDLSLATDGAFDPAAGPVIRAWREARQQGRIPSLEEIAMALQNCGYSRFIQFDEEQRAVRSSITGVEVDLGSIGKGYALDRVAEGLIEAEIASFLAHGGFSTMVARGSHHGHPGWPVGLRNPLFPDRNFATVMLRDRALSTSGSNVQFFRYQGKRYGHILDPRTGWPVDGMLSVTVTAPTAELADALSTAFYVMGIDASQRYCQDHPEIGAILIPRLMQGRELTPSICNLADEDLFWTDQVAD